MKSQKIIIAGAGIGGLAAASCLMKAGHRVEIYEQAPQLGEIGAGIQISANAMHVMRYIGVGEQIDKIGVRPEAYVFRLHDTGEVIQRFSLSAEHERMHGAPYTQLHRADLHHLGVLAGARPTRRDRAFPGGEFEVQKIANAANLRKLEAVHGATPGATYDTQEAATQAEAVQSARLSTELTLNQYKAGTVNYLNVVTVQATQLNNEATAVKLQGQRLVAAVTLVQALGDSDMRIKAKAIDALGNVRANDAVPVLIQQLFLRDTETYVKQRILASLGKIGDQRAASPMNDRHALRFHFTDKMSPLARLPCP